MTTIAEYTRGYNNGRIDKTKGLPMNMPNAVSNTQEFKGYFHGYRLQKYKPPVREQAILDKNIAKFNFIT